MLKCLVIHGSARKGNTYKVTKLMMTEMSKYGDCDFIEVFIRDLKLPFCNSCFACFDLDEKLCPHHEKVDRMAELMKECDALIIGSPIYILQINAETKNLLDHLAYCFHRPRFFSKKALVITTTAGAGAKKGTRFLRETLYQMGYNFAWELPVTCWDKEFKPKPKDISRMSKLAGKFYLDVVSGKLHRPSWYHIIFHTAFRAAAWSGRNKKSADFNYWNEKGLLTKAHPISPGLLKTLAANTFYALMKRVIPS